MASLCNFPTFSFSFSLPTISISLPLPQLPTLPTLNVFCPLD